MLYLKNITLSLLLCIILPTISGAQGKTTKWTITPLIGGNDTFFAENSNNKDDIFSARLGIQIGITAEYHFNKTWGLLFGAFYSGRSTRQYEEDLMASNGKSVADYEDNLFSKENHDIFEMKVGRNNHFDIEDYSDYNYVYRFHNLTANTQYIDIPLMINCHIPIFHNQDINTSLKIGLQESFLLKATAKGNWQTLVNGKYGERDYDESMDKMFKKSYLSLPFGLGFAYKNLQVDLLINAGLTDNYRCYDTGFSYDAFLLNLGYNINL